MQTIYSGHYNLRTQERRGKLKHLLTKLDRLLSYLN